jgi:hypothetical protein
MTKMILLSGLFLFLISTSSFAQEFPKRSINFLIAVGIGQLGLSQADTNSILGENAATLFRLDSDNK